MGSEPIGQFPPEQRSERGGARSGVLAFGDSITNAGGELQLGVALQSWALWTARGLGVPYTPYAVDGATVRDVVGDQIPRFAQLNADPEARFMLGCLYVGTNDTRRPDWNPAQFAADLDTALAFVSQRCERILCPTLPRRMGRPVDPVRINAANAVITAAATAHGALILDLGDFGARNVVMADHVHPTALGQVAIAERALARLAADGVSPRTHPTTLIAPDTGASTRLRADLRYVTRCAKQRAGQALRSRAAASART